MMIHLPQLLDGEVCERMYAELSAYTTPWANFKQATDHRDMVFSLPDSWNQHLRNMLKEALQDDCRRALLSDSVAICGGTYRDEQLHTSVYFYKYMELSTLGEHYDSRPVGDANYGKQFASVIFYLNDNFIGGDFVVHNPAATDLGEVVICGGVPLHKKWTARVRPLPGDAIVISNDVLHSVDVVASGNKYIGVVHCA